MKCLSCEFDNPDTVKFCGKCGRRLEIICPHCGGQNPPEFTFCGECGHDLGGSEEPAPIDLNRPRSYTPEFLVNKILTTRSAIEGERKLVTVLSADVFHFTAISEKLDPENVHSVMDGCFRLLIKEVHECEGTINQFLGDGIMAIFGAPVTHEDHIHRACHAALSIQRALADYAEFLHKTYAIDFMMRIGLNTGQVVVGTIGDDLRMDYTALGDTTNIAFLLQQVARPGQIVVSDKIFRVIKGYFNCKRLGEKKLKNKETPVTYYELQRERRKVTRLDVEEEEKVLAPFVNRKEDLNMMLDLFKRVKNKDGQVLCIVGDAGQGKSRLIYEFKKQIDLEESVFLESQCISYGKSTPYYPIVEILKMSFGISDTDSREKIRRVLEVRLKKLDRKLQAFAPILFKLLSLDKEEEPLAGTDPEQAREMIFEALRSLILSGSQIKPLIFVVENLQWMDSTSEEFLSYMVQSIASFPVFLILTYRVGYAHPFGSRSYLRQISLNRLSDSESKDVILSIVPKHRLPDDFIRLILDKADGNPLYLEEIIKSLMEKEIIVKQPRGYTLAEDIKNIEIPDTIQEIVLARVDRLEENSKITIQAASVIGREFTLKLLARQRLLENQLKQYMKELKNLELVREKSLFPDIEYMFKNTVTKDVIYGSLLLRHRKELHRKVAEAIEKIYGEKKDDYLEMLAHHYLHSDAVDKAISYLVKAGGKAKSVYANHEAIEYYRKALDYMDQNKGVWDDYRKEALQSLADLYDLIGDYSLAVKHYEQGIQLISSPIERSEVLRKIGMVYEKKGDLQRSLKCYEEAIGLISQKEHPLVAGRIYMNIGWIHNRTGDYGTARDFCNRALQLFRRGKNDSETAQALNNLSVIYELSGQWDLAEKLNEQSVQLIKKVGDQRKLGAFYISSGLLSWKRGNLKKAKNYFKKSLTIMEPIGSTLGTANASLHIGTLYVTEENLKKAFPLLNKSLAMFQKMGTRSKLCQNHIALAEAYVKKGELEKAEDQCMKGLEIALEVPYPFDEAKIQSILGEIASRTNGNAEEHFLKSMDIFSSLGRKYELALAMEKYGQMKMDKGQTKEGEKYVGDAAKIFKELGVDGY